VEPISTRLHGVLQRPDKVQVNRLREKEQCPTCGSTRPPGKTGRAGHPHHRWPEEKMKSLPYDTIDLVVNEPLEQARIRLMNNVGPGSLRAVFSSAEERPFSGKVEATKFKIYRKIQYRNSFLPILNGTLEQHLSGTRISVRMRMHLLVIAFLAVWIGTSISFAMPFTAVAFWVEIGQAGIMIGAALLMTYAGFWYEAKRSKKAFLEIFAGTEANQPLEPIR